MAEQIHHGRYTADLDGDIVVLLIGARVNELHKLKSLWLVMSAMPRMIRRLVQEPELGLLGAHSFQSGRTSLMLQYWESHEKLQRFATDRSLPHAEAWARYVREIGSSGDVGVWHETYVVPAGNAEAIYANMPVFGLAAATRHAPVQQVGQTARARLAHARRAAQHTPA